MTRTEKIQNIIKGTTKAIEEMEKDGTLTTGMRAEIINNMNNCIAAINA